ncbi:Sex-regulated protein janus-A [Hondaea fermentalgiana]|uniref:Sex-regulated protein janus-A n=1 Tax=Hondaea fermentalgiana TaxID=2315210 RepID=A0A2R5GAQ9_9STRA|nr:Sex-regulated protein janus-A [Hondaea fermentalgiana]|eukprot:GBG25633.1 Sex-regulated protein janus-A [Hondaea fermentalgiana]
MSAFPDTTEEERAQAAAMREGGQAATAQETDAEAAKPDTAADAPSTSTVFDTIQEAGIDEDARQKYVLIKLTKDDETKFLVRGRKFAAYHKDAAQPTIELLQQNLTPGMYFRVMGGGRITHSSETKKIEIFGYSYGFPWQDEPMHETSKEVLAKAYPDYTITTSNEGY